MSVRGCRHPGLRWRPPLCCGRTASNRGVTIERCASSSSRGHRRSRCSSPTTTCSCAKACARCSPRARPRGRRRRRGLRRARRRRRRADAAGRRDRHPHAAELPERGHRGGQGGAQAPSGHRRRRSSRSTTNPEYAISLLAEGAAGYAYLLKDRVGDGDRLVPGDPRGRDRRLDARPGDRATAMVAPVRADELSSTSERTSCCRVAEGRPVKAIAAAWDTTPEAVNDADRGAVPEAGQGSERGTGEARCVGCACCRRRSSTARNRARRSAGCCRAAWPRSCGATADELGRTERLDGHGADVGRARLLRHRRARRPDGAGGQLNTHRAEMNAAILDEGGTVMQYVGDAVMAVFGAPFPQADHADRALRAAAAMHERQAAVNATWRADGLDAVRARHRAVDRRGRGGAARERRAARVHARRRHGEPGPAAAGPGPTGRETVLSERDRGGAAGAARTGSRRWTRSWSRDGRRR